MTGYFQAAPRPLHPGDIEPVRDLVRGALGATPYVGRVMELLDAAARADAECDALIMERDGTVAALALFGVAAGARDVWRLHTILLADRVDRRDAGATIVEAVVQRVRTLGARMLVAELPTDPAFGDSLPLLRANDFEQEGRIADFFRDGVALLFLRRGL